MITSHKISTLDRSDISNYLINKKSENPNYKIIDVGGSMGGWSHNFVDAIVDFNEGVDNNKIKHFKADINLESDWNEILKYVLENGKFDFCICTHTLEDIVNPSVPVKMFNSISKAGYIATPSKYRELSYWESDWHKPNYNGEPIKFLGYIHHRWIFDIIDGQYTAFPKINFIDSYPPLKEIGNPDDSVSDLSFFWEEEVSLKIINNGFLGPSMHSLISYYNALI